MLIDEESPLRKLPITLNQTQLFLLEGIRYSAEMAYHSYYRINNGLLELTNNGIVLNNTSIIFLDIWSFIDNIKRFKLIAEKLLKKTENYKETETYKNLKILGKITLLRNSYQHIDERITDDEIMIKEKLPLFGCINWIYSDIPYTGKILMLRSGVILNGTKNIFINPNDKLIKIGISNIMFEGYSNSKKIIVEIEPLLKALRFIVKLIEKQLLKYPEAFKDTHASDLFVNLTFVIGKQ